MKIRRDKYNLRTYFRSEIYGNMIQLPKGDQIALGSWVFDRDVSIHDWEFDERKDEKLLKTVHAHTETINMR